MEHKYKGYIIVKNGVKDMPWNIYKVEHSDLVGEYREWVGFDRTMKACKETIDSEAIEMCEYMCD